MVITYQLLGDPYHYNVLGGATVMVDSGEGGVGDGVEMGPRAELGWNVKRAGGFP